MTGEIHGTCEIMSGRMKNIESEIKQLKNFFREILRRLPEEPSPTARLNADDNTAPAAAAAVPLIAQAPPAAAAADLPFSVPCVLSMPTVAAKSHTPELTDLPGLFATLSPDHSLPYHTDTPRLATSSTAVNSVEGLYDSVILDLIPSPSISPLLPSLLLAGPCITGNSKLTSLPPKRIPPSEVRMTYSRSQAGRPSASAGKRKADNAGALRSPKRRK